MQQSGWPRYCDLGICHHAPDDFHRLIAAQRIANQHRLSLGQPKTPSPLLDLARIGTRQVELHPGEVRCKFLPGDASLGPQILIVVVDQQGVVRFGPGFVIRPTLFPEIPGKIVIVGTEVAGPTNSAGVEHEGAEIQMRMRGLVIAALHRQKNGGGIVPRAAKT